MKRCTWAKSDSMIAYHDTEWGVPVHDDPLLFEFLVLGGAQAGLSWETILKKRANYRTAFDDFDVASVARYGKRQVNRLLADAGIVRNRLKIESALNNAKAFLPIQEEFGGFDAYIWRFTGGKTKKNAWRREEDIPVSTVESETMSKDLKGRGFKFVGPTICYAFMQAVGIVNDHIVGCFRYSQVSRGRKKH